jgi:hypothetical protein
MKRFLDGKPAWPVPWLAALVWVAFYVPRVGRLGFYYADGWVDCVAASRGHFDYHGSFAAFCVELAAKPVALAVHLAALALCRGSAARWQAALALAMLASALALYRFFRRLERTGPPRSYSPRADLAVAVWLIAPLCLGATALPNMFNALVGQGLFFGFASVAVRMLDEDTPLSWRGLALASALLAGSYLSYETYYFQFATVLGLAAFSRRPAPPLRRILACAGAFASVQALCIAYNRGIGLILSGVGSKQFYPDWWSIARPEAVWSVLSYNLPSAVRPYGPGLFLCAAILAGTAAAGAIAAAWRERSFFPLLALAARSALLAAAYWVATVTYALAAYGITFLGVESRVAMTPVFLLACTTLVFLEAGASVVPTRIVSVAAAAATIVFFGLLHVRLIEAWKSSWDLQREVLKRLHRHEDALRRLDPGSVVVFLGPYYVGAAPVYAADPQLTIAVREEFPFLRKNPRLTPYFLSIYNDYTAVWDGRALAQSTGGSSHAPIRAATDAWLWDYFADDFRPLRPGERLDPRAAGAYVSLERARSD